MKTKRKFQDFVACLSPRVKKKNFEIQVLSFFVVCWIIVIILNKKFSSIDFSWDMDKPKIESKTDLGNVAAKLEDNPTPPIYAERNNLLKTTCKKFEEKHKAKFRRVVVWNEEKKIAFCPIEKCGSSTWLERMNRQRGSSRWSYGYSYGSDLINIRLSKFFSFVFVREPFVRLVSAYRNKVVESNYFNWRTVIPKNYQKVPKDQRQDDIPTFEEFLDFLLFKSQRDADGDFDVHVRPYWHQCDMCNVEFNMIGKIETMKEDTDYLLSRIQFDDPKASKEYNESHGGFTTEIATEIFFSELPRELVEKLVELFKFEFEAFDYDYSKYLLRFQS